MKNACESEGRWGKCYCFQLNYLDNGTQRKLGQIEESRDNSNTRGLGHGLNFLIKLLLKPPAFRKHKRLASWRGQGAREIFFASHSTNIYCTLTAIQNRVTQAIYKRGRCATCLVVNDPATRKKNWRKFPGRCGNQSKSWISYRIWTWGKPGEGEEWHNNCPRREQVSRATWEKSGQPQCEEDECKGG